jgi:hypothetical protein
MASSGMLRRVALVRTDVSEELIASIIRVTRFDELGTTLAVTSKQRSVRRLLVTAIVFSNSPIIVTLIMEALSSSETSVLTIAKPRNIPEDAILQGCCRLGYSAVSSDHSQSTLRRNTFPPFLHKTRRI